MTDYPVAQADGSVLKDVLSATLKAGVTDTIDVGSLPSWAYIAGAALVETIELGLIPSTQAIYAALMADKIGLAGALRVACKGVLIETLQLDDLQTVIQGVRVIEKLMLGDSLQGNSHLTQALVEELALNDVARIFFGGFLSETIGVGSTATRLYRAEAQVGEDLVLADLLGHQFIMQVTITDGFEIADDQLISAIYHEKLTDNVHITGGVVTPNGTFTTWAINTRTNAVTEYQNYAFNSFAQAGHRFLGATDDGLYVLDGEVDAGEAINTRMRSGIMQLAGSKFTMFKAAYLGVRTNGSGKDFILKLIYGDGENVKETCYKIVAQNLRTARVNLGKGIRSRYVSWELQSLGVSYSLDSIEFIPISSQRHV